MKEEKRTMRNECWSCKHRRDVPGDCNIGCVNPDHNMTGNTRAMRMGWFCYPMIYDPVWKEKDCDNYEANEN